MNKNKKIAMAAVAAVMAGAMIVPLAACDKDAGNTGDTVNLTPWKVLDDNGNIDYSVYERETPVTLNIAIGYDSNVSSTSFATGSTYTLADGNTYKGRDMKPAWKQMGEDLHITWNDVYNAQATSANLDDLINRRVYANTDIFTTDLSVAVSKAAANTPILNLANYLDYMPNYKAFLEANPVVYLSLLQDGMNTTNGSGKRLYIAPYFDGNDDIERYCIIRQDWAEKLLDGDTALTGGTAWGKGTSAQAFMPGSGNIAVDITLDEGEHTGVGKIYKNYDNVKSQITTSGTALYAAYHDIANADYPAGGSGNIVDIMNAAIAVNNNVTGAQLVTLFRAYIDACYTKTTGTAAESYYAAEKRSNLFNGYDAAWDVDDLVAMLRCVMTNQSTLLANSLSGATTIRGIAPRGGQNDRTPDMVRLACQLYGARGADSRLEYTYIDKDGKLQDARNDKSFYEALDKFSKLREEGLVADYSGITSFSNATGYIAKAGDTQGVETFMMYDYCQTQTLNGFYADASLPNAPYNVVEDYNFAPILTPVSKWNVDGSTDTDGNATYGADEYFRFTESWRSTKTSGIALNGDLAKNENKLKAALQFVDYLYSEDGQIVSTFGPKAENAQGTNGFWYGEEQTNPVETTYDNDGNVLTTKNYFTYRGKKYQGYPYKGTVAPKITGAVYDSFQGKARATGTTNNLPENVKGARLSFTNYARFLIGSTLPVGVKNQAFEDQLTSRCGKEGSAKVAAALANTVPGTNYTVVRGMSLDIDENNWWYTCVPTGLPVTSSYVSQLNTATMNDIKYLSGEAKEPGAKNFRSIFNSVILNGIKAGSQHNSQDITYNFTNVEDLVEYMSDTKRAQIRENVYSTGWDNAKAYWNYLKSAK